MDVSMKQKELSWTFKLFFQMEQDALKIVNNCLNTNIYSYLEKSGGQSSIYI